MITARSVIQTQSLTRSFGNVTAVSDLTIQVSEGEVFGFLGHNGAGKTTTVRLLNGILGSTSGGVKVLGLDPLSDGPTLRRQTGVLTETPSLDDRLTAREALRLYGQLYGVREQDLDSRVEHLLRIFDLSERADELVGGYSKGMRQRLALGRTLIHQPRVIFLDEPTAGLDPVARRHVHDLIVQQSSEEGHTVFLCTHDLAEAQKLCDRVAVMEEGKLVAIGTPEALARDLHRGVRLEVEVAARPKLFGTGQKDASVDACVDRWQLTWNPDTHQVGARLPSREAIPEVIRTLATSGTRIYSVALQEATLEDVYFAIHDQHREEPNREATV